MKIKVLNKFVNLEKNLYYIMWQQFVKKAKLETVECSCIHSLQVVEQRKLIKRLCGQNISASFGAVQVLLLRTKKHQLGQRKPLLYSI